MKLLIALISAGLAAQTLALPEQIRSIDQLQNAATMLPREQLADFGVRMADWGILLYGCWPVCVEVTLSTSGFPEAFAVTIDEVFGGYGLESLTILNADPGEPMPETAPLPTWVRVWRRVDDQYIPVQSPVVIWRLTSPESRWALIQ